jgi:hypothetical protein
VRPVVPGHPKVYEDGPILCGLCTQPFTSDDDTADLDA